MNTPSVITVDDMPALVIPDKQGLWTVIGIPHAVVAWGESRAIAVERFAETLVMEEQHGLEHVPPAPAWYQELYGRLT